MVGQYQIDTLTTDHSLSVTDTISENNIVVVTPENPQHEIFHLNQLPQDLLIPK